MKKKLAMGLATVMALGVLAGCGGTAASSSGSASGSTSGSTQTESTEKTPTGEEMKVDVFYYDFSDIYISSVRSSMDTQLGELGIKPENWDAAGSQPTQTDQVKQPSHVAPTF